MAIPQNIQHVLIRGETEHARAWRCVHCQGLTTDAAFDADGMCPARDRRRGQLDRRADGMALWRVELEQQIQRDVLASGLLDPPTPL